MNRRVPVHSCLAPHDYWLLMPPIPQYELESLVRWVRMELLMVAQQKSAQKAQGLPLSLHLGPWLVLPTLVPAPGDLLVWSASLRWHPALQQDSRAMRMSHRVPARSCQDPRYYSLTVASTAEYQRAPVLLATRMRPVLAQQVIEFLAQPQQRASVRPRTGLRLIPLPVLPNLVPPADGLLVW